MFNLETEGEVAFPGSPYSESETEPFKLKKGNKPRGVTIDFKKNEIYGTLSVLLIYSVPPVNVSLLLEPFSVKFLISQGFKSY